MLDMHWGGRRSWRWKESRVCLGHPLQGLHPGKDVVVAEVSPPVEPVQPNNDVGENCRPLREASGLVFLWKETVLGLSPEVPQMIVLAAEGACDTPQSPDLVTEISLVMVVNDLRSPAN